MGKYLVRRVLIAIPQLFIISVVLFVLMYSSGDPVASMGGRQRLRGEERARLECKWGLDQPIMLQYVYWLVGNDWVLIGPCPGEDEAHYGTRQGVLRGDFGDSLVTRQPAVDVITERIPNTLTLMLSAEIAIVLISLFVGIYSALNQYSRLDHFFTGVSFALYSMPIFWTALLLIYIFAINFKKWGLPHLPTSGMYDPVIGKTVGQVAQHLILPVAAIAAIDVAKYSRYIRSNMLEVINSDYIRTARSKGLTERRILYVHALKNASLPIVTLIGLDLPLLLAGAVVTERIFAWPGMGRLFLDSLERSDFPVLMGLLMMVSFAVVLFQLLTDVVYTWLDPRIRYS